MKPDFPSGSRRKGRRRKPGVASTDARERASTDAHGRASARLPAPASDGAARRIRIIGGEWRGRWLDVVDSPGLRPTGNRVRETLFNWLQMDVPGARCLDLFAGSGALGLEAASRGAALVTLVEREQLVVDNLRRQVSKLSGGLVSGVAEPRGPHSQRVAVVGSADRAFLAQCDDRFDLVFLDPPFDAWSAGEGWLHTLLRGLATVLADEAKVYLEGPAGYDAGGAVPAGWRVQQDRAFGEVQATLFTVERPGIRVEARD